MEFLGQTTRPVLHRHTLHLPIIKTTGAEPPDVASRALVLTGATGFASDEGSEQVGFYSIGDGGIDGPTEGQSVGRLGEVSRFRPKFNRVMTICWRCLPTLAQISPNSRRFRPTLAQIWSMPGQFRSNLVRSRPTRPRVGHICSISNHVWVNLAEDGPMSVEIGPKLVDSGLNLGGADRIPQANNLSKWRVPKNRAPKDTLPCFDSLDHPLPRVREGLLLACLQETGASGTAGAILAQGRRRQRRTFPAICRTGCPRALAFSVLLLGVLKIDPVSTLDGPQMDPSSTPGRPKS